jgi:hypothetical protein
MAHPALLGFRQRCGAGALLLLSVAACDGADEPCECPAGPGTLAAAPEAKPRLLVEQPPVGPGGGQPAGPPPSAGMGGGPERPVEQATGSPYDPWPLSFPKVLGGLLYFEEQQPELVVSTDQCHRILPQIHGMGMAWQQVMSLQPRMVALLTPEQERWIFEHKGELETAASQREARQRIALALGQPSEQAPGLSVVDLCAHRAQGDASDDYERATGELAIVQQDIATGLVFMDDDPALRITPYQAARLGPLFEDHGRYNQVVGFYFQWMLDALDEAQVLGVQEHIRAIVPYKSAIYDAAAPAAPERYDPLFDRVIALCEAKRG